MDFDWKKARPRRNCVIVKADPRVKQSKGGILLPDQTVAIERVMEGTGRLVAVGDEVAKILGDELKVGDRICYRGFLKDAAPIAKAEDGCQVFVLRAEDVLAVVGDEVDIGAFS
jgi:co-chaperonin GroES (HSP10)